MSFNQNNQALPATRVFGRKLLLAVSAHYLSNACPLERVRLRSFLEDLFGSVRRVRRCTVKKGKGPRVVDGVRMIDEDGANVCIRIRQDWCVGYEIKVARPILNKDPLQQQRGGSRGAVISIVVDKISFLTPP